MPGRNGYVVNTVKGLRAQNFPKIYFLTPLTHKCTCAYQGVRKVSFSENFTQVLNEWILKKLSSMETITINTETILWKPPSRRVFRTLFKIMITFFVEQFFNWLVSLWNAALGWNGLMIRLSIDVYPIWFCRCIYRVLSNTYKGAFCENSL